MAILATIGTAVTGLTGTAAAVAGGAIVGAVAGAAVAAANGDNILEGALKGGVIGAVGGYIGAAAGWTGGTTGASGTTATGGMTATEIAAYEKGLEAAGAGALTTGETIAYTALLEGASEAYGSEQESEATKERLKYAREAEERTLASQRATPTGSGPLEIKNITAPWQKKAKELTVPGQVAAPTVQQVGAQQVGVAPIISGFQETLKRPTR